MNIDFAYGDNLVPCTTGLSLAQCRSSCESSSGCYGFCYHSSDGACCLKNSLGTSNIVSALDSLSVVVNPYDQNRQDPIEGWDFNGNDLLSTSGTYDECIQLCLALAGCGMVKYSGLGSLTNTTVQPCWLKSITSIDWKFNDGFQSYLLPKSSLAGTYPMYHCLPCPAGAALSLSLPL